MDEIYLQKPKFYNQLDPDDPADMVFISRVCHRCKHFTGGYRAMVRTCEAYPDGIPSEIWIGNNDHTKPYDGDNGIQFEKSDTMKKTDP